MPLALLWRSSRWDCALLHALVSLLVHSHDGCSRCEQAHLSGIAFIGRALGSFP